MSYVWIVVVALLIFFLASLALKVIKRYEQGVPFRFGRVIGVRPAGPTVITPSFDVMHRVSLGIVAMPIQSHGVITNDNISVDVSVVVYLRVGDAVKSVVAIERVGTAINQITQTILRKVVGQHTLDETLSGTDHINADIKVIFERLPTAGASKSPWSSSRTFSCLKA